MDTWLSLEFAHSDPLPDGVDELRTPDALVERFLREHTDSGDRVFDPFAGFGTTLVVAERLGREGYGLEYEAERVEHALERLESVDDDAASGGQPRQGSVLELDADAFPACDYCFTSPPFMAEWMDSDPFLNYDGESTYADYLDSVAEAFRRVESVLAPGARIVVDVANMKHEGEVTTLAWDLQERLSSILAFEGEVVVAWTGDGPDDNPGRFGYGYDHSYCLVFSA